MSNLFRRSVIAAATLAAGLAAAPATAGEPLSSVLVEPLLRFPTNAIAAPGDFTRLYIVEKRGRIRVLNTKTGAIESTFMDIDSIVGGGGSTNNEQGLLGFAFDPAWPKSRDVYVYHTNNSGNTTVARYVANDANSVDLSTRETILVHNQPFGNHNGGWIGFGPNDGYLYVATGDGGSGGDPGNRSQDITNQPLGKMLRIDPSGDDYPSNPNLNYAIPADNPFVGVTGDDEIWAYGLRNPWRCSFDMETGDLWIADVGQNAREEINFQPADSLGGENYGWRCREGNANFNFGGNCASQTFTEPVFVYSHSLGRSVTGGMVYRGCQIPSMQGEYFFGDFVSARIWSTPVDDPGNAIQRQADIAPPSGGINRISTFAQDNRGELYILEHGTGGNGELWKLVAQNPTVGEFDWDCSGEIDFGDLLILLAEFGDCDGCISDINGNHQTDFNDLLILISAWG